MEHWKLRFFSIWGGQALSLLGSGLVHFALVWWLTTTTGSATVLALGSLAAMLPQVVIGPLAGAVADRWNRLRILIAADGTVADAWGVRVWYIAGGVMEVGLAVFGWYSRDLRNLEQHDGRIVPAPS